MTYLQTVVPLLNTAVKTRCQKRYMLHEELSLVTNAVPAKFSIISRYASFRG